MEWRGTSSSEHPREPSAAGPELSRGRAIGVAGSPLSAAQPFMRNRGPYLLLDELGRGGMGVVHLALFQGPGGFRKFFALKDLREELADDESMVAMFLQEGRVAAQLDHPHVVQTVGAGSHDGRPFLVMEYLDGEPLQRITRTAKALGAPLRVELVLRVLLDLLQALEYLHGLAGLGGEPLGLVHRDVCPQNVLVTHQGTAKLIDFGVCNVGGPAGRRDGIKGRTKHMAPECVAGAAIDGRADLYAVGMMLWRAVAGAHPWDGLHEAERLRRLLDGRLPRFSEQHSAVDAALAAIVDRATSADPGSRYPSAAAMREDLERYARGRELGSPAPLAGRGGAFAHGARDALAATLESMFAEDRDRRAALIRAALEQGPPGPTDDGRHAQPPPLVRAEPTVRASAPERATPSAATGHRAPFGLGRIRRASTAFVGGSALLAAGMLGLSAHSEVFRPPVPAGGAVAVAAARAAGLSAPGSPPSVEPLRSEREASPPSRAAAVERSSTAEPKSGAVRSRRAPLEPRSEPPRAAVTAVRSTAEGTADPWATLLDKEAYTR